MCVGLALWVDGLGDLGCGLHCLCVLGRMVFVSLAVGLGCLVLGLGLGLVGLVCGSWAWASLGSGLG